MRNISIVLGILLIVVCGAVIGVGQQQKDARRGWCAYATSCQSYEVVKAGSIDELTARVRQGLKGEWRPEGGIVYDSKTKHYIQIMVHPRKVDYP